MIALNYVLNFDNFKSLANVALVDGVEHALVAEYDRVVAEGMVEYMLYRVRAENTICGDNLHQM